MPQWYCLGVHNETISPLQRFSLETIHRGQCLPTAREVQQLPGKLRQVFVTRIDLVVTVYHRLVVS